MKSKSEKTVKNEQIIKSSELQQFSINSKDDESGNSKISTKFGNEIDLETNIFSDENESKSSEKPQENESQRVEIQDSSNRDYTAYLSSHEFDINSNVIIDEQRRMIYKSRKVTIDYNPRKNKLIIKQGFEFLNGEKKLKDFIKSLGYKNQAEFMKAEFTNMVVIFGMASITRWYNDLTENYFSFR